MRSRPSGDASVPPRMAQLGIGTTVADSECSLGAQYAAMAREDGHLPPGSRANSTSPAGYT